MSEEGRTIPEWDDLCDCVLIPMQPDKLNRMDHCSEVKKESVMKDHYERHQNFLPDADCIKCNGSGEHSPAP